MANWNTDLYNFSVLNAWEYGEIFNDIFKRKTKGKPKKISIV